MWNRFFFSICAVVIELWKYKLNLWFICRLAAESSRRGRGSRLGRRCAIYKFNTITIFCLLLLCGRTFVAADWWRGRYWGRGCRRLGNYAEQGRCGLLLNGRQTVDNGIGHGQFEFTLPIALLLFHGLAFEFLEAIVNDKLLDESRLRIAVSLCRSLFGQTFLLLVQRTRLDNHLLQLEAGITVEMILGGLEDRLRLFLQHHLKVCGTQQRRLMQLLLAADPRSRMHAE